MTGCCLASYSIFPFQVCSEQGKELLLPLLGALDDKIELNRRMNETLEAMARADLQGLVRRFRSHSRQSVEGRAPYLAPELWDLFPDVPRRRRQTDRVDT